VVHATSLMGTLIARIDPSAQSYRWWHKGLHRLDFTAALRGRPDVLMLILMCGVTGFRRLIH
jgi:hypothetical protein